MLNIWTIMVWAVQSVIKQSVNQSISSVTIDTKYIIDSMNTAMLTGHRSKCSLTDSQWNKKKNKIKACPHSICSKIHTQTYTHTHTRLTALFPGLPRWAGTRQVKPIWILLKQETVSGSGISWAICKSAPCCRQTTTPAPHHSVFYRPDALPAAQPTASKHWRHYVVEYLYSIVLVNICKHTT